METVSMAAPAADGIDNGMRKWIAEGMKDSLCGCGHKTIDHTLRGDCVWPTCHNPMDGVLEEARKIAAKYVPKVGDAAECGCGKQIMFRSGSDVVPDYWSHVESENDRTDKYGGRLCRIAAAPAIDAFGRSHIVRDALCLTCDPDDDECDAKQAVKDARG